MIENGFQTDAKKSLLDRPVFQAFPAFSWEKLLIALIVILAVVSRFAILGERVMSHDEVNHVVPAYTLSTGGGYAHDPVTHGPFQFHLLALSYFLLGDNDFSARVPAALFSIAAVLLVLLGYRRYLGRIGALTAGFLMIASPLVLFYGRYTRNEAFIELFAVATLYYLLRYLEKREDRSLVALAAVTALQFVTKEVSFIYTAQLLVFCGLLFLGDVWRLNWASDRERLRAMAGLALAALIVMLGAAAPKLLTAEGDPSAAVKIASLALIAAGGLVLIAVVVLTVRKFSWAPFRAMASFNLIVFIMALILPQLTALPVVMVGFDPLDYSAAGMAKTGAVMALLFALSIAVGLWWNRRVFIKGAVVFYLIFIVFYTTMFSNGQGFFTGIVGSLGYWLSQQEVQRGGQPLYYYAAVIIPIYEFAAVFGTILAIYFGIKRRSFSMTPGAERLSDPADGAFAPVPASEDEFAEDSPLRGAEIDAIEIDSAAYDALEAALIETVEDSDEADETIEDPFVSNESEKTREESDETERIPGRLPVLALFLYWGLTALLAYSIAGEKMPWLAVHIALPLALSGAWGFACLFETIDRKKTVGLESAAVLGLTVIALYAFGGLTAPFSGGLPPFTTTDLAGLKATGLFVSSALALTAAGICLVRTLSRWSGRSIARFYVLVLGVVLIVLQARTAYQSSFVNYDSAREYLVYAHASAAPKVVLRTIEEISARTGEGKTIRVAYDNDARYPYWWYFRDYTGKLDFNENATRDLRNYDIIIANTSKDSKLMPIVGDAYYRYEYMRLWWPNQDYFRVTADGVLNAVVNGAMRRAVFDIWLNRDFSRYAKLVGSSSMTAETWEPSAKMVVYMKKDLLRKMWKIGDASTLAETETEASFFPDEKFEALNPVFSFGEAGTGEAQLNRPRNLAVAPGGDVYVLNTDNARVDVFDSAGAFKFSFDNADHGGFNQPWGIAVDRDGAVFVADTWNHRILRFGAKGEFELEWAANVPNGVTAGFYGPRAIAIDGSDRIYVTDTGNKRVLVYDRDGRFLFRMGEAGMGEGDFDEPVGIATFEDKYLAVADTWNQRVQVFDLSGSEINRIPIHTFEVYAWYSQSMDNKPYLTFDRSGNILFSDPESGLIWQYSVEGQLIRSFNAAGGGIDMLSMPVGLTMDAEGSLWLVDALANRVNRFELP